MAGAKEGGAFLQEFRQAGFGKTVMLRKVRNARTSNPKVEVAEVSACRRPLAALPDR